MNPPTLRRYAARLDRVADDLVNDPVAVDKLREMARAARVRAAEREHRLPDLAQGILARRERR